MFQLTNPALPTVRLAISTIATQVGEHGHNVVMTRAHNRVCECGWAPTTQDPFSFAAGFVDHKITAWSTEQVAAGHLSDTAAQVAVTLLDAFSGTLPELMAVVSGIAGVADRDDSYPCGCGTCPTFLHSGSFCSRCLVSCELDLAEPSMLELFPQTAAHDELTQRMAELWLSEVA